MYSQPHIISSRHARKANSSIRLERVSVRPNSKVILPYEPGYTGHWEMEKRRKETREWLREREQQVIRDRINNRAPIRGGCGDRAGKEPHPCWRHPSEQFCSDCRWQRAQAPQLGGVVRRVAMSKAEGFRQYAEEAVRWARKSKTEQEKQALMDLACTWTQAAVQSEYIFGVNDSPPEHRAL
jgi:hypothetical protein